MYNISQCHRYTPHHTDITVCTTTHRHTTLHSVTHIHNTVQQQSTHIQHVSIKHTTQDISNLYYQRGGRIPTALTVKIKNNSIINIKMGNWYNQMTWGQAPRPPFATISLTKYN